MEEHSKIIGACHCGGVRFSLLWPESETTIQVRTCGCSFCRKHGGAWTSHRDSKLNVHIENSSNVSQYSFGTKTADFYVCAACGVVPVASSDIEGRQYAIVNVNTFENVDRFSLVTSSTDFDGEDLRDRLERRARNWIPAVQFDAATR